MTTPAEPTPPDHLDSAVEPADNAVDPEPVLRLRDQAALIATAPAAGDAPPTEPHRADEPRAVSVSARDGCAADAEYAIGHISREQREIEAVGSSDRPGSTHGVSPLDSDSCLRDPGEFIAAVPAMLGFPPARSLVVTALREDPGAPERAGVDVVVRLDLDNPGRAATAEILERVAGVCVQHNAIAAIALIVDDRATPPAEHHRGVRARRHRDLIHALEHRLDADGIPLAGAWAVTGIGAELPWWSLLGSARRGRQPDPASSMVTLRQVLEGRPLRGSRAELTDLVAVDSEVRAQVVAVLDAATAEAARQLARAVRHGDPDSYTRAALRKVLWHIANVESGARPDPPELAELAVTLRDKAVRDMLFGLMPGRHADAAESLWLQLTRVLPDPDRAEAAALLGYAAYVRGDGPLAGIALEAALSADPEHRMAVLLDIGLHTGMHPNRLHRLAASGREAAADLGIDLGAEHP
ncbi:DUF4192 domain-containing protein [Nocardia sp. IFM 10818]